jgi:hypothetical protein
MRQGASIDQMTALGTSFAIAQVIIMPLTASICRSASSGSS